MTVFADIFNWAVFLINRYTTQSGNNFYKEVYQKNPVRLYTCLPDRRKGGPGQKVTLLQGAKVLGQRDSYSDSPWPCELPFVAQGNHTKRVRVVELGLLPLSSQRPRSASFLTDLRTRQEVLIFTVFLKHTGRFKQNNIRVD